MRLMIVAWALLATPAMAAGQSEAERKIVSIGDIIIDKEYDTIDGIDIATTALPIDRKLYWVNKIRVPSGTKLRFNSSLGYYCTEYNGYSYNSLEPEKPVCLADIDQNSTFDEIVGPSGEAKLKTSVPYSKGEESRLVASDVQTRLIYMGGTKDQLKVSYREFTRYGLARPAFTEEFTIPLAELPSTVTIKGAKLTIHGQSGDGLDVSVYN